MKRTDSWCIRPVFLGFVSIWRKEPVGGMPQGGFCRSAGRVQVPRLWDTCVAREPHLHGSRATLALHLFHTSVLQTGNKRPSRRALHCCDIQRVILFSSVPCRSVVAGRRPGCRLRCFRCKCCRPFPPRRNAECR